jgi:hypothetical protein
MPSCLTNEQVREEYTPTPKTNDTNRSREEEIPSVTVVFFVYHKDAAVEAQAAELDQCKGKW